MPPKEDFTSEIYLTLIFLTCNGFYRTEKYFSYLRNSVDGMVKNRKIIKRGQNVKVFHLDEEEGLD